MRRRTSSLLVASVLLVATAASSQPVEIQRQVRDVESKLSPAQFAQTSKEAGLVLDLMRRKNEYEELLVKAKKDKKKNEETAATKNVERVTRQAGMVAALPPRKRIAGPGAKKAGDGQFPYQVGLVLAGYTNPYWGQFCGGTLIRKNWVVTAAHCFRPNSKPEDVLVFTGSTKLSSGGRITPVSKIIRHASYDPERDDYDIAVLKLGEELDEKNAIPLLPADQAAILSDGKLGTVSGWGDRTEGSGTGSDELMFATAPVVDRARCNSAESYDGKISDRMFCAGNETADACQGDSGGPLVVASDNVMYLAGVVSWGEGCARPKKYGVYTHVPTFLEWIQTNAKP